MTEIILGVDIWSCLWLVGIVSCFLLLSRDLGKVVGCCLEDVSAGWWVIERRAPVNRLLLD